MATRSDIMGALARGYCHKDNSNKEMDAMLLEAQAEEIVPLMSDDMSRLLDVCKRIIKLYNNTYAYVPVTLSRVIEDDLEPLVVELTTHERGQEVRRELGHKAREEAGRGG